LIHTLPLKKYLAVPVQVLLVSEIPSALENFHLSSFQQLAKDGRISDANITQSTSNIFDLKSVAQAHRSIDW